MKQDLNDLAYFVHVVDHGGFAPAGRVLGEPKSKLSRRIANLEDRLGVQLIVRSTRHFVVTEIGQNYYQHCQAMLLEARAAEEVIELTRAEPCGIVRMTCPVGLLHTGVTTMLARFMTRYPQVELHMEATDRRVDLISEGVDLAIRIRPTPLEDSELVMRSLGERRQCLVASPLLLKEGCSPTEPSELSQLPSLGLGGPREEFEWILKGPNAREARIRHQPRMITLDMRSLRSAAVAGVGVVQLPYVVIREELEAGALVELLPEWAPDPRMVHLVFVSHRGMLLSVRTLIDFLVEEFGQLEDN